MNARFSLLRARMAPTTLAAAVALAFGLSAPVQAQAQYTYPGTASSSGHVVRERPARERAGYGSTPSRYGNPSMRRGEACPPGSNCGTPVPEVTSTNGGSPDAPSAGYGSRASYGAAPMGGHSANSIHPIQAGGKATPSPLQAGMGREALNYGTSQSAAGYRNTVSGQSSGPNTKVTGQQNSFSGPNGQVNMGNQTVTGPNGQVVGQQSTGGKYGGGYGQQKGSGIGYGNSGAGVITQTGSAPGMASANGMNMNNGGTSGASEQAGAPDSFGEWVHRKAADSDPNVVSTTSSDKGTLTWHGDQKWSGTDDAGLTWSNGKPWDGPDGNGGSYQSGHHIVGVQNQDSADMGGTSGPGEVVSGTGQIVHLGRPGGQDTGGGRGQDAGNSGSGSNKNATGQYATSNTPMAGQDAPVKPKEQGALKVNYNGKNGVTDPKLNGGTGGGG